MRVQARTVLAALLLPLLSTTALAEDWVVSKSTGQVWHATANAQPVALGAETKLQPGDLVQTGASGRVMLTRGAERILVAPNSVISLPKTEDKPGFTTILQQAGSIAVEAEKKDHKHFEVLTPYLAAVVKGTQFTVSVAKGAADVNVASGKVEVADVKSGKIALVLPGQFAKVGATSGLSLGGQGKFEPITQGAPRTAIPAAVSVPRQGFDRPIKVEGSLRVESTRPPAGPEVVRLEKALGPVTLDVGTATAGLIRTDGPGSSTGTMWKPAANGNGASNANVSGNGNAPGNGASSNAGAVASPGMSGATPAATGVSGGMGANAVAGTPAASGGGINIGVNAGNAFGLNGGNGIGKALGLSKKN